MTEDFIVPSNAPRLLIHESPEMSEPERPRSMPTSHAIYSRRLIHSASLALVARAFFFPGLPAPLSVADTAGYLPVCPSTLLFFSS